MAQDEGVHLRVAVTVMIVLGVLGLSPGGAPAWAKRAPRARPRWQTLPEPPALPKADTEGTVDTAGAKIYYATYGKGEPVVLLHGGLGNSAHFGFQVPALADKFQVITIDSRGQGRSTHDGKTTITYDLMAADVIAVLDQLAIPRASVVGWSDGGEVALKLGIAFPDRVDRLFVFAANYNADGSKSRNGPSVTFSGYYLRCRRAFDQRSTPGMTYKALVDSLLPLWRTPTGITKDQLRAIKAPVMMADGDRDEVIVLAQIREMAKLIPNAQLTVFPRTSHFALWQDPVGFNRAVVDFLTPRTADRASERAGGGASAAR